MINSLSPELEKERHTSAIERGGLRRALSACTRRNSVVFLCRMSSRWWELDKASSWLSLNGEAIERQGYGGWGWDADLRDELVTCLRNHPSTGESVPGSTSRLLLRRIKAQCCQLVWCL